RTAQQGLPRRRRGRRRDRFPGRPRRGVRAARAERRGQVDDHRRPDDHDPADRRTARVGGFDVVRQPLAARRVSSVVFQEPVVDRSLIGRRNLEIHASLWQVEPRAAKTRIAELTDALGIAALVDRPVSGYSGGERRRLELARALVSSPSVLFLDEPTVGLDPRIRQELLEIVGRLGEQAELTILLTTHYLDEAERLAD